MGKKAILMAIYEILRQYSDGEHPLSIGRIGDMLEGLYGVSAERKAVSRNLHLLRELGYDIHLHGEDGQEGYYLRGRPFTDAQLRLLIDGVLSSQYIPREEAQTLIEGLTGLSTVHFSSHMAHIWPLEQYRHRADGDFFATLESIGEAIDAGKKIRFVYQEYGLDGRLHPRRERPYEVSPYLVLCANSHYYLLANYDGYDEMSHYRVDRISQVEMLPEAARDIRTLPGQEDGLTPGEYARQHRYMFSGEPQRVVMRMDRSRIGDVVDAFGPDTPMRPVDRKSFEFTVYTSLQGVLFWVMQYAEYVQVQEPKELKEMLARQATLAYEKFAKPREE